MLMPEGTKGTRKSTPFLVPFVHLVVPTPLTVYFRLKSGFDRVPFASIGSMARSVSMIIT
jgi:hypothetical protein